MDVEREMDWRWKRDQFLVRVGCSMEWSLDFFSNLNGVWVRGVVWFLL
jgi:hypothetical protein